MTDRRRRAWLALEGALLAASIVLAWWLGAHATDAWIERASELAARGARVAADDVVRSASRRASLVFSAGVVILALGRGVSAFRAREPLHVPFLVPAAVIACLLGLTLHHATVETVPSATGIAVALPSAPSFAQGFLFGAIAAAVILVAPVDLARLASRLRLPIAVAIVAVFASLFVAGTGPGSSGARINLGPIQPIEAVKLLFVAFLAAYLGARAAKLRWQRRRALGLRWPRPVLLVPALAFLVATFSGLFLVGDLGPVSILALVFLGMFYVVTRATGWAVLAVTTVAGLVAVIARWPDLVDVARVATRVRMWLDPWWNALPHGDQLGESLWAVAAGGVGGRGLARASVPLVPAGKTDLVIATMVEQLGAVSALVHLLLLATIAASGLYVAYRSRTPERVLLAAGLAWLLVIQWAVIHAGTLGLFPLTGVVVPFLSSGRTSMVVFVAVVAILARLAEDGRARSPSEELSELHRGARGIAIASAAIVLAGAVATIDASVLDRERASAMGIVTRLRDGTVTHRQNPRLTSIADRIRRGTIADRNGVPIAVTLGIGASARRAYPLAAAMGTLLGVHPARLLLPPWALERALDLRLRGYGERADGPTYGALGIRGRRARARIAWPDLRSFVPLIDLSQGEQLRAIRALDSRIAARSVRLSIDARLQREVSSILRRRLAVRAGAAAAAAVVDPSTGQILARAQVPDYDPNDSSWQSRMLAGDSAFAQRWTGAYGEWPDKTGLQGMFQTGSVGKLFTALAAARQGWSVRGGGCDARSEVELACVDRDAQGPFFTRPGWPKPIHDHSGDAPHGRLDFVSALAVSCNVYFAQLGLSLGPGPFVALERAGAEVGYGTSRAPFDPGAAGTRQLASTAFGQGAAVMNVLQAARLTAAIGAGGAYRRCAPTMELGAPCSTVMLAPDPSALAPILAGMRRVMLAGTGRSLRAPPGVRVYGKTGTADVRGFAGEEPFDIQRAQSAPPHSWFVALAEPESVPECALEARTRLAIAVVVPRGGTGASNAGPIAMEIVASLRALGYFRGVSEVNAPRNSFP